MNEHPIVQTMAQLGVAHERFQSTLLTAPDEQAGWQSVAEFVVGDYLPDMLERVAAHYPTTSTQAPAALWFGHYAFAVMAVPIACYLFAGRVPDMSPARVGVRFEADGDIGGLAWHGRAFAARSHDPAEDHPDCTALASRDALRDQLCQQFVAHLTPVIEAAQAASSFGQAGLWALAADYCAQAFAWVAQLANDEARGVEEARLLAAQPSPLHRRRDFILVEQGSRSYHLVDRLSCCLYYKVEGGGYCSSCPHRPRQERITLIQEWLAGEK